MSDLLVGASGRPLVCLGGSQALRTYRKGEVVLALQYLHCGEPETEPCMALFAANPSPTLGGAYVIPQRNAHLHATNQGHATPELMGAAFKACVAMGLHPSKSLVHQIMDVVLDAVPELLRMPSIPASAAPEPKRLVHGIELSAKVNGKTVHEGVV